MKARQQTRRIIECREQNKPGGGERKEFLLVSKLAGCCLDEVIGVKIKGWRHLKPIPVNELSWRGGGCGVEGEAEE